MSNLKKCPKCIESSGIAKDELGWSFKKCSNCEGGIVKPKTAEEKNQKKINEYQEEIRRVSWQQ